MNVKRTRILTRGIVTLLAALSLKDQSHAVDGTWILLASGNGSGSWPTTANWNGGTVASGIDALADFSTLNITATSTVTLDGARTVGTLKFGDATTSSSSWVLNTGSGGPLTMDVTTGQATINVVNQTATIGAVLAGTDGINVTGNASGTSGTVIFNAANTFSGGLTITGAIAQMNNATGAGANTITVAASTNTASANKLAINGGVTIANNVIINAGASPLAGQGAVQSVGTGQGTVNGTITINGSTANGGHFVGGTAVGNELVLGGAITSSVGVVQREGRVIYRGTGSSFTTLTSTGGVIIGANNALPTGLALTLSNTAGGSAGLFDLNNFNQTVASINVVGGSLTTIQTGTGVLTLNGNFTSALNFTHVFNGNVNLGGGTRAFTINDGTNAVDLQAGAAFSNGNITKVGAGTMVMNGISAADVAVNAGGLGGTGSVGALAVNAGTTLFAATPTSTGTLTSNALTFGTGATTVRMDLGATNDLVATGALVTNGTTTFNINQFGGIITGQRNLITYTGVSPGLTGFALAPFGHATASLVDTGTAIAVNVTANDRVIWDGTNSTTWATGASGNWKLQSNSAATDYIENDEVIFQDNPLNNTVNLTANVTPAAVTFNNATTNYTLSGTGGIGGMASITKTGAGTVTISTPNTYNGTTTINEGTLTLDLTTGTLTNTSVVAVAPSATFQMIRQNADFAFAQPISGSGTVVLDPNSGGTAGSRTVTLTGNNSGFTGLWKLSPNSGGGGGTANGTFRLQQPSVAALGSAAVQVDSGGQLWFGGNTYANDVTISGTGYSETSGGTPIGLAATATNGVYVGTGTPLFTYGGIGALRLDGNANVSGDVTLVGNAKVMAFNSSATISGAITSTANDTLVISGGTGTTADTVILTGNNSYGKTLVNGGSGTTSVTHTLQIGNNGTSGTPGTGEIVLFAENAATARIDFRRSDGLVLTNNQNITAGAATSANLPRAIVMVNSTGSGLTLNNTNIDLSDGTNGGAIHVAGIGGTAGISGAIFNITGSSTVDTGYFTVGDAANMIGTVNQSGTSSVSWLSTLRIGHYPTETSSYNISGGSLTALGTPTQYPFQTVSPQETNGGIYVGIDGTGNFTQTGGIVTTNFIVLDNRGDTVAGANTPTGIDTLQLNGGTLVLKHAHGIISRNASTAINFNGGTIQAAAGINPALDSNRITVQSGGVTLDTNGGNTFNLYGPLAGTGTVALTNSTATGNGVLNLVDGTATATAAGGTMPGGSLGTASIIIGPNTTLQASRTTGVDTWAGNIAGVGNLVKQGTGTVILTGNAAGFAGSTTVSGGRLDLPATFGSTAVTVADGAALGGEPVVSAVVLGASTGSTLFINPSTAGALTTPSLTLAGTTSVDFSAPTAAAGTGNVTVLNYTALTGTPNFALANAANYRSGAAFDTSVAGTVTLTGLTTKELTWTGATSATWDVNATTNWNDTVPAAEKFFTGDRVTFGDGPTQTAVTVTSGVTPWRTTVNSATAAYTLTSTANGIAGPGNLEKSGASTLTLSGPNTYSGKTILSGGAIASTTLATSLGNGSTTNTIELSGGARLSDTGAVALDLGANRNIIVGTGGGSISHNNATAATITIPGKLIGSGANNLSFHTQAAGGGTYVLTGDNSGYTGTLSVDAQSTGLTTLRIGTPQAAPAGGSIALNYPAAGVNGNAGTLDLVGVSIPGAVSVNMSAFLNGAISLRSQITGSGASTVNGPVLLTGNAGSVVQMSPASGGSLTFNGNIGEAAPGSFGTAATRATLFFRGAGNTTINGTINLPTGNVIRVDDTGITTINSTGNVWAQTEVRSSSTLRIGTDDALATNAPLLIGQASDAGNSNFDLNGFNQTVAGLNYVAGNGANSRGISNSKPTLSTLTINNTAAFTYGNGGGTNPAGNITGNVAIVKNGAGTQTLAGATNSYTGNVTVNAGTLVAGGNAASTALGSPTTAGRAVTVNNSGTTLSLATNNVFGNGVGNANLPAVTLNAGTTLTSTRYNVLGPVTLNGATLTQSTTDSGTFEGYQFKGAITVGGTAASTISTGNSKANHLDANTVFTVANATGDATADLTVGAPLRNQSNDFASAAGGLTKEGVGTLVLSAINTYTGATVVNDGTLFVSGSISGSTTTLNAGAVLGGTGTLGALNVVGGTIEPGASPGTLATGALSLSGSSTLKFELAQAGVVGGGINDLITVTGGLTLDGTLQVTEMLGFGAGTYRLFDYSGALTNNGLDLTTGFLAAHPGSFVDVNTANQVNLVVVPEPSAMVALLGGCGVLLSVRRGRRLEDSIS